MGVPKFYRWISERYPCLSQVVKENQIPEFDNLYLDMNGIIHVCSHPNDDDPHFRITEEKIFTDIFHYIEVLFRIIRPKRNFFMAVDGVAPRAKMNQQRGRRFRTAKEAEDNIRKALQKGEVLPKEDRFDSNCITPGTGFMARLQEQLKYFVNKKISTDPQWQECTIYLSGHNVPGEGEHKVMDFIRYMKSKDDYDPNTRHCLYGLDADLIILGLATHEPHFSLLREEVRFGKQAKRMTKPEQTTWHLLHLSLMREYLDFEFQPLKEKLLFPYDTEKIIDDWVLMGFLVGNDFVPHLPNLHINQDALPLLYRTYIEVLPQLDGYLNDEGVINLQRMEVYMKALTKFEDDKFQDMFDDLKWLESKSARQDLNDSGINNRSPKKRFTELLAAKHQESFDDFNPFLALADVSDAFDDSIYDAGDGGNTSIHRGIINDNLPPTSEDDKEMFELEFKQHRRQYYREKFGLEVVDDEFVDKLGLEYMRAIQWILHYYYNGVQSWSWYFPYHYSPYVSDIRNIGEMDLKFDMGAPFKPFEQLLAVLPSASKTLLPEAFQSLMISQTSPIIDYYPVNFKTDLNGKQQEWEAVVLIPFIDETRLWAAMKTQYSRLTKEEKGRNSYGSCLKYCFSPDRKTRYLSSFPGVFEDIEVCKAECENVDKDAFRLDKSKIKKGLCEGVKQDVFFPGFPTFKHIPHTAHLKACGVKVFQQNSRKDNMIINIKEKTVKDVKALADELVGKVVYAEWPYLIEANVVSVATDDTRYIQGPTGDIRSVALDEDLSDNVKSKKDQVQKYHIERRGIKTSYIDILVEAKPLKGKRYNFLESGEVALDKEWAEEPMSYAYQTVVKNLSVYASMYTKVHESIEQLFPVGCQCFMMASPHYGCAGEVLEVHRDVSRVRVELTVPKEPNHQEIINRQQYTVSTYMPSDKVARLVGISTFLLSRITSSILIDRSEKRNKKNCGGTINIGLKLKYSSKKREALGYTRFQDNRWSFSPLAVDLIKTYTQKFPEIFDALSEASMQDKYYEDVLFPKKPNLIDEVSEWLTTLPCYNINTVKCGTIALEEPAVKEIEAAVLETTERNQKKKVKVRVKPHLLFRPMDEFGDLVPDPSADFYLFDRVVNVSNNGAVPYGLRGTVIGIYKVGEEGGVATENESDIKYEILFDHEFLGARSARGVKCKCYYLYASSLLNISYGERKEIMKAGKPASFAAAAQGRSPWQTTSRDSQGAPSSSPTKQGNQRPEHFQYSTPPNYSGNGNYGSPYEETYGRRRDQGPSYSTPKSDYTKQSPRGSNSTGRNRYDSRTSNRTNESPYDYKTSKSWREDRQDTKTARDESSAGSEKRPQFKGIQFVKAQSPEKDIAHKGRSREISNSGANSHQESTTPSRDSSSKSSADFKRDAVAEAMLPQYARTSNKGGTTEAVDVEGTAFLQSVLKIPSSPNAITTHSSPNEVAKTLRPNLPRFQQRSPQPVPYHSPQQGGLMILQGSPQNLMQRHQSPRPPPPSFLLENWTAANRFPVPNYTYSETPQGVHCVVAIGPALRFGGVMCRNRMDAYQSAALAALSNLPTTIPQQMVGSGLHLPRSPQFSPAFAVVPPGHSILGSPPGTRIPGMAHSAGSVPGFATLGAPNLSQMGLSAEPSPQRPAHRIVLRPPRDQCIESMLHAQKSPQVKNMFIPSQVERMSRTPVKDSDKDVSSPTGNSDCAPGVPTTPLSPGDHDKNGDMVKDNRSQSSSVPVGILCDVIDSVADFNLNKDSRQPETQARPEITQAIMDSPITETEKTTSEVRNPVNVLNLLGSTDSKQDNKGKGGQGKKILLAPSFFGPKK